IIENVQRTDLDPLEEAAGYQRLGDEFGYSQADLAKIIGKSRSHLGNSLRLLSLPQSVQALLREGKISAGHARALLASQDPAALAQKIAALGLSVREAEKLAETVSVAPGGKERSGQRRAGAEQKPVDTQAMEKTLMDQLGMKVTITHRAG